MRFAYADPPYIGQASKHYRRHASYAGEVDHRELIARLVDEFRDGWALSASSPSLRTILPLCPERVRVMAWVKPFCSFKKGVNPAYAWEPIILCGGRRRSAESMYVRDWVSAPMTTGRGVSGAKPELFCVWLFEVLGAEPGDDLVDLFPGSGAVQQAWRRWQAQTQLHLYVPRSSKRSSGRTHAVNSSQPKLFE
ncbi:hypothetical protein ACTI_78450 [Actinoplanes sp. OR16]|nr:hypothetical protein ACTI_78450 [Actinoplanes sp. OR16]